VEIREFRRLSEACARLTILLSDTAVSVTEKAGRSGTSMSTMHEVRTAEEKMNTILDGLKTSRAEDPNQLGSELKSASDEYERAIRELEWT
jgi:hypothetical protein